MRTQLIGFPAQLPPGQYPAVVTGVRAGSDGKLTMILEPAGDRSAPEDGYLTSGDKDQIERAAAGTPPLPRDLGTPQEIAEAVTAMLREYGWDVEDVQMDPGHWILGASHGEYAPMSMVFAWTQ